jgi:triacylglycerol lipase
VLRGVTFGFDSAEVDEPSKLVLEVTAEQLNKRPGVRVRVEGHTDSTGPEAYNQGLSERRARSVRSLLIEKGVVANRLEAAGFGASRPIASNDTSEGRALNRRVETRPEKLSSLCGEGVGTSSRGEIGWLAADATDVTARFRELLEQVRKGEDVIPPEAHDYLWILAPGLFSDKYPNYMRGNVSALRDHGLRYHEVDLSPDESVRDGAQAVRQAILDSTAEGEKVVILGHSKGAIDAAAALSLYPEIRSRVRTFVAIQTPYAGSPVATDLANCPALGSIVAGLLGAMGENPEAAIELTYGARRKFVSEHPFPERIPTLSLATSRVDWRSLVSTTGYYVRNRYGVESDGLVVPVDAVIPGSRVVYLDDMDHAEVVLAGVPGFINYRASEVTQVLVAMALAD